MKLFFEEKDKNKKMTDKTFSQGMIISLVSVLLCIVALCSASYAWFSAKTSSGQNLLQGSSFALDVTVTDGAGNELSVTDNQDGTLTYVLGAAGDYQVTLRMSAQATATKGYCGIVVGGEEKRTSSISRDSEIGVDPFVFTLTATENGTSVTFMPKWGIPATSNLSNGETWVLGNLEPTESPSENKSDADVEIEIENE